MVKEEIEERRGGQREGRSEGRRDGGGEREKFSSTCPFIILESNSSHQSNKEKMEKTCKRNKKCHLKSSRALNRSWSQLDDLHRRKEKGPL